jgi:hypothetical protein
MGVAINAIPGRFTPGETRYSSYSRLGGPQGRAGRVRKITLHQNSLPGTVQPVASDYSGYATPAHFKGVIVTYVAV